MLNVCNELLVFFLSPCSFLQPFCSATRCPYHSWFLIVTIEARERKREREREREEKRKKKDFVLWSGDRSKKERTWSFDENIKAWIDTSYRHIVLTRDYAFCNIHKTWYPLLKNIYFRILRWKVTEKREERTLFPFTSLLAKASEKFQGGAVSFLSYACVASVQTTASFLIVWKRGFQPFYRL